MNKEIAKRLPEESFLDSCVGEAENVLRTKKGENTSEKFVKKGREYCCKGCNEKKSLDDLWSAIRAYSNASLWIAHFVSATYFGVIETSIMDENRKIREVVFKDVHEINFKFNHSFKELIGCCDK